MNARTLFLTTLTLLGGALPRVRANTNPRFVEDQGHLVVFEHDGSLYDRNTTEGDLNVAPRQRLVRELIRTHGDLYDFIVVFTNFDFDRGGAIGFYTNVRNDVEGIGLPVVDNGDGFGSPERLQGLIDMGPIDQYRQAPFALEPGSPGFRTALGVLAHELGHRWLVGVRFHDGVTLRNDLLGKDDAHWSFLLSSDASFLYGNAWEDLGGGSFRSVGVQSRFNELDLYLMGFLAPEDVSPLTLLANPDVDRERLPELSAVVSTASVETVTLDQIIAAEGPRMPGHQSAQKDFNVAFVFLSGASLLPTERDLEAVEALRTGFGDSFFALTRGRALVDANLQHVTNVTPGAEPDIALALEWLLAQQKADGRFEAHPLTPIRDTATALTAVATLGIRGPPVEDASAWLGSQAPASVDYRARIIAAGVPLLAPPLESLRNPDGGFGLAPGYASEPLDTALALVALHATGAEEAVLRDVADVLVSMQRSDGSWSAIAGQPGDILTTSEAVRALELVGGFESTAASGLAWLVDRQELDGGVGDGPATPYATALALEAFLLGNTPVTSVDRAVTYLQQTQRPDGSWGESVFETASVLRALVPSTFANLSIEPSDVHLSIDPPEVGETVAIDVTVRNRSRVTAGPFDVQLFDGDPEAGGIALGAPQLFTGLDAGGTATASFTWDTSGLEGPHTLYAIADFAGVVVEVSKDDNTALRNVEVLPPLPNLVVSFVEIEPARPVEGTTATISARIENVGSEAAAATTVRLFREVPRLGIVLGEGAVPALPPGNSVEIPLEWANAGPMGSHSLHAIVDPDHAVRERSESDNETTLAVDVRPPPPAQPDLEIPRFTLVPGELERLPEVVTATASIANTGLEPVPSALVELFQGNPDFGGVLVASQGVSVPGDDHIDISFDFDVTTGGTRTYYLRVDPGGVVERDPDNNLASAVLRDRMDVIDVTLLPGSIVPSATVLDPGDTLFLDVEVRNRGTRTLSSVAVALFYEVAPGGSMRQASVVHLPLDPGASMTATLSWRANRSGTVPLELRADPDDVLAESNETDNVLSTSVDVTDSTLPNLTLVSSDIVATPTPLLEAGSASLEARVVNLGGGEAAGFDVRFFAGHPDEGGRLMGEATVPALAASSDTLVSVTWDPIQTRGEVLVYVEVDAASVIEEIDEEDNVAFRIVHVEGLPDLLSTSASVRLTPAFPRSGEGVTIASSFTNAGAQPSAPMAVEVRLDDPDGGALVASSEIGGLAAGESTSFEALWDTSGLVGEHSLYLVLDVRDDVLEQREDNNVMRVPIALQDADVFVTPLYFSPNGDGLQDEAALFFRLQGSEELRVEVRDGEERVVRDLGAGLSPNASVVWDGRDDRGVLAPDGAYSFVVLNEEDAELLRRRVVLDTNRSGIVDALGTDRVSLTPLTCELPERLSGPAWLPSDRAAYFIVNRADAEAPDFPVGLYRISSDGRDTELILAADGFNDMFFAEYPAAASSQRLRAVSALGDRALVRSPSDLGILDLATGTRVPLGVGREARAAWTPGGERALVASPSGLQFYDRDGTLLETLVDANVTGALLTTDGQRVVYRRHDELVLRVIGVDGSGDRRLESTNASGLFDFEVFPDDLELVDLYALDDDNRVVFHWFVNSMEQDAGPFLLDLDADAHEPYPFDDELSSDGRWELVRTATLHVARRYRGRETRPILPTSDGFSLHWSYRDTHLSFVALGEDACLGNSIWAIRTLDNGEADLRLTRLPSSFGIRITGTASDRNLEAYTLDYAPVATPDLFTAIEPPSAVPVIADILTTWIPPAPGDYLVRLTVRDRAGNETVRLERIFWDETPPIASLRRSPSYLSPNGDGRQDELLVQYDVLAPANLVFHVRDEEGRSVRTIARDESAPGPASFVWDGRDDAGQPLDDGRYLLEVLGAEIPVFVDQTPPDVDLRFSELYTNAVIKGNPELAVDLEGHILDAHLDRWDLVSADGEVLDSEAREVGTENEDALVRERLQPAQGLELRAYDLAGNETVVPLVGPSREVRVLRVSADPVGPFAPGPPQTIAPRAIRPDGFFTASAAASFEGELRFLYHAEGEATFTEIPAARSVALRADELTLGTRYLGHFESDGVSSEPVAFTVGPEAIFLEAFGGPVTSWVLTNTIEEPLVEGRLLRTMAGVTEVLATFAPVPGFARGSDGRPPCGTVSLYRVEATGLSGTRYDSTTPEAYPNSAPDGVRGSDCLDVQDVGIEAQRGASDPVPTEATALVVNELFESPPETLFLDVNGTEVGSGPGDIGSVSIPFDVGGLSEDRYTLTTRATLSSGETIDGNFGLSFLLDQSPPEITILSPIEGASACVVTENGRELVAFDLIVRDRQIMDISVEMLRDGSWKGLGRADPLPLPVTDAFEGTLRAILPEGAEGAQTFRVVARSTRILEEVSETPPPNPPARPLLPTDFNNGTLVSAAPRTFVLTRALGLGPLSTEPAAPALFSPNDDDTVDEIRVRGEAREAVTLTARVYTVTPTPVLVRTLVSDAAQPIGPFELVWDGRDDNGLVVADGDYAIEVESVNGCGGASSASVEVTTDTTPPTVAIENLVEDQPVSIGVEVVGTADDPHFDSFVLEAGEGAAPASFVEIAPPVTRRVVSRTLGNWSVGDLAPGPHTLRLTAVDAVGNRASTRVTVEVVAADFIALHRAEPSLFSPNGDAQLDETEILFELEVEARVTLEIRNANDGLVASLIAAELLPAGPGTFAWNGVGLAGLVPDGTYDVVLQAEDPVSPALFEESRVTLVVDTTSPEVVIASPVADGFLSLPDTVRGSIDDEHLERYAIEIGPAVGVFTTLVEDSLPATGTLASLRALEDGSYRLRASAGDQAGNRTELTIAFEIDSTPPILSLSSPTAGAFLSKVPPSVDVSGEIEEPNLERFDLEVGFGDPPNVFVPLAGGVGSPPSSSLASWNLEALPDGEYTLRLSASDKASNFAIVETRVTLDATAPTVALDALADGEVVADALSVRGTLDDANFLAGTLSVAPAGQPVQLTEIASFDGPRVSALLAESILLADGDYLLELRAIDRSGNVGVTTLEVSLDSLPPDPPSNLTASVEGGDVTLQWDESPSSDVVGYHVSRDGVRITTTAVSGASFIDTGRPEGRYRYQVVAVDRAELESEPTEPATAIVDLTPPSVALHAPDEGEHVRIQVDIVGTAFSENDFFEYRLSVAPAETPERPSLLKRSGVVASFDTLFQWQALVDGDYVLILEAEDTRGNVARVQVQVTVDNEAPAPPLLVRVEAAPEPDDVEIEWEYPSDTDVEGFLVYRNGHLANAPGNVSGSLRPFLVAGPVFSDLDLVDGEHCYHVVAMDLAGNLSNDSNQLCVFLDNRAPAAVIFDPENGARFDRSRTIRAWSEDEDIATVDFEFQRAGELIWSRIGTDGDVPFEIVWDVSGLDFGDYRLRAIATDIGTRSDPAPAAIEVVLGDVTPPSVPLGLAASVMGDAVALGWDAVTDVDLGGYRIYRDGDLVLEPGSSDTTATDAGVPDGLHDYTVSSVDLDGNESEASESVAVRIYAPVLLPDFPVLETAPVSLSGKDAEPAAALRLYEVGNPSPVAQATADPGGHFTFPDLALALGPHVLEAEAEDVTGNVSRRSEEALLIWNEPPVAPGGLQAIASGDGAEISWDASVEPDLSGYLLRRDGELLNPRGLLRPSGVIPTGVTASASTSPSTAGNVIDGTFRSWGMSSSEEHWIELNLDAPRHLDEIRLLWSSNRSAEDYDLLAELEGRLAPIVRVRNNSELVLNSHTLPVAIWTSRVRLQIYSGVGPFGVFVNELELIGIEPETTTSFTDLPATPGFYDYTLSVIDRLGSKSNEAGPVNLGVGDLTPPEPPTALDAVVIEADVWLSWTASVSGDVARYRVFRDGVALVDLSPTSYVDRNRLNGTYTYYVVALDGVGNASVPSNEAEATVGVAPPDAPLLSLSVPPEGSALALSWTESTGPLLVAEYVVLRASSSGGPYAEIARLGTTARSFVDRGLTNGVERFYVVRAIDLRGESSADSNEVSGTPEDVAPPPPPIWFAPTTSGVPIVVTASRTTLVGLAEPGSEIDVVRDGVSLGSTLTSQDFAAIASTFLGSPDNFAGRFAISPDRRFVAEVGSGYSWNFDTEAHLYDLASGDVREVPYGLGPNRAFERGVAFSPDGRRIAVATTLGTDTPFALRILDLESETTEVMPLAGAPQAPAWISDEEVALVVGDAIAIYDLSGGTDRTIYTSASGFPPEGLSVSSDRAYLAWREADELFVMPSSGGSADLVVRNFSLDDFAWAGARTLAFTLFSDGLHLYDVDTASAALVPGTEDTTSPRSLDIEGVVSAFRGLDLLWVLPGGTVIELGEVPAALDLDFVEWGSDLALAGTGDFLLQILETPGRFGLEGRLVPGLNRITARARDGEGNESLDSEAMEMTFDDTLLADLAFDAPLSVIPAAPLTGQSASLSISIVNQGQSPSEPTVVSVTGSDLAGNLYTIGTAAVPELGPGAHTSRALFWTTLGLLGTQSLVATLDPLELLDEADESNNQIATEATVVGSAGIELAIAAGRAQYGADQNVELTISAVNGGSTRDVLLETIVEDGSGVELAVVDTRTVHLRHASETRYAVFWNTGSVVAGSYVARVRTDEGASGITSFEVTRTLALSLLATSDRAAYEQGDQVGLLAELTNVGSNTPLRDLSIRFKVLDGARQTIFETTERPGYLAMGGSTAVASRWRSGAAEPGGYALVAEAFEGADLVASADASFVMDASSEVSLRGVLELDEEAVPAGSGLVASYAIENESVVPLENGTVRVELVDPNGPNGPVTLASAEAPLVVGAGETSTGEIVVDTSALTVGRYTVVLSVHGSALDTSPVTLFATPAAPSLNAPANGASAPQRLVLSVNNASNPNDETLTYEFELYLDPGLSTRLGAASGLPEGPNTTAWAVLSFLQENRRYYWRARAADRFATSDWMAPAEVFVDTANEPPEAPTLSEPAEGAEVETLSPALVVGNARDPDGNTSTYTFEIYRGLGMTDLVERVEGVLEGSATTSFTPSSDLEEDQTYTWRARANDGELDSPWMTEASFRVNTENHAPTAPVPVAPNAVDVPTLTPELLASIAVDPENGALTYTFQIDRREAFDSPERQESLELVEPRWTPPSALEENGEYFWRVRASDGIAVGPWSETARFRVDVLNEPPAAPTAQRPADRSFVESVTPVLAVVNAMDPEEDGLTYRFEVYEDEGLTTRVASIADVPEGASETAWEISPRLVEGRTYYWRALANDGSSNGPFSTLQSFVVNAVNAEPGAPERVAPAEGANVSELAPTLIVINAIDPDGDALTYRFEIYADELLSQLVERAGDVPEGVDRTSFTMSAALEENHLYYWRARATDGLLEGPWMDTARFRFSVDNEPPTAPLPEEPADGDVVTLTRPSLVVGNATDPEEDALRYRFFVYQDSALTELVVASPDVDEATSRTSWQVTRDLDENGTYFWRALATDGDLESPPSEAFRFTVDTIDEPPRVPLLVLPADGSSIETTTPSLVIENATSPDGETLHYHFALYTDEALTDLLAENDAVPEGASGQTSWEPSVTLDMGATYFWRARAIDARGLASDWSSGFRFTVEPPSPGCPPEWRDDFDDYPPGKSPQGWWLEEEQPKARFHVVGEHGGRRLSSVSTGRGSLLFAGAMEAFEWRNYAFSGEVIHRGAGARGGECVYRTGVVFYARPHEGTSYRLELTGPHCDVPRARLVKRLGGNTHVLAEIELDRHLDDQNRPLGFRIEAVNTNDGTSLRAHLKGQVENKEREWTLAYEDREAPLRAGTVGAFSNFMNASWDEFHVREIEGLESGISGDVDGDGVCDFDAEGGDDAGDCDDGNDHDDHDHEDDGERGDRVNRPRRKR